MADLDLSHELMTAAAAVRGAASVCRAVQRDLVTATTLEKKDKSPVTVADFASQALVCAALAESSRVQRIVGEEDAHELREEANGAIREQVVAHVQELRGGSVGTEQTLAWIDLGGVTPDASTPAFWTLDPIDGTKGFLRGEHYAIALALIRAGEVVLGVLGCPRLDGPDGSDGALLAAVRGSGAWILPLDDDGMEGRRRLRVSEVQDPAQARFCESVESEHSDQDRAGRIAQRLGIRGEPVRVDSQAKYAIVARGDASIYLRLPTRKSYREKIWDHAAGAIVVEEAGGRVTDVAGAPLDFSCGRRLEKNRGVVATNGAIHDAVLRAVAESLEG
jgi:HAL2 family 3'(2'),5'-bisphosphate nucleotidase